MATSKTAKLKPDEGNIPIEIGRELGYTGLKINSDQITEEANRKLRFPYVLKEIDAMKKDSMIAAAIHLYHMMVGKSDWWMEAPNGASAKAKERAKVVDSMLHDMDRSWSEVINSICSFIEYGFSVHEIVPFVRLKSEGSKNNDGYIGIKKLASRSQHTIDGWKYDDKGRELKGVWQSLANLDNPTRYLALANDKEKMKIFIPKERFLLVTADTQNDSPVGNPPLKSAWTSWKYKYVVIESELNGLARDLQGVPVLKLPARYMSPDASDGDKAVYEAYKAIARNVHSNSQAGIVMPSDSDPEARAPLFTMELLQTNGSKGYATDDIIKRFNTEILMSLYADLLQLGNTGSGSFALSSSKTNIISFAIQYRLKEIQRAINSQLIPYIYDLNGWDKDEMCQIMYSDIDDVNASEMAKAVQLLAATGSVEMDRPFFNMTRSIIGLDPYPEDDPVHKEYLPEKATSRSGDGIKKGSLDGTSDSFSSGDDKEVDKSTQSK